jgi:outer membrane protein OmpA-like peptidoglycan-associated protein/cytochrome c-type biogenesis protein CcmH/NrfG
MKKCSLNWEVSRNKSFAPTFLSARNKATKCAVALFFAIVISGCQELNSMMSMMGLRDDDGGRTEYYDTMIARFTQLRQEDPENVDSLVGLVRYLRYAGRTSEAIDVLESERGTFADNPEYLTELGAAYLAQGRTSESKKPLERSLRISPNYWRTYAALGIADDFLQEYDQAAAAHAKALEFCPESASIRNNLGISVASNGDIETAITHLSRARDLEPENNVIRKNFVLLRDIRTSCPDCSAYGYRQLPKAIHSQDWPVGHNTVTCNADLTRAQEIVNALLDSSFVDMRVYFAFDTAVLRPEGEEALDELAQAMMSDEMRDDGFVIEGHTDAVGTRNYNQGLSERRAAAVREYLMKSGGVQSSRLSTVGYGKDRLLDPANPKSGTNRRVRVTRVDH